MNFTVAGIPARRVAANAVTAALAGLGCGKCWRNLEEHPGTGTTIVKYSMLGGIVGGMVGLGVGVLYGQNMLMLTMTQSMYGYLMTAAFLNIRSVISHEKMKLFPQKREISDLLVSAVSGGLTGMIPGILFKSRVSFVLGGCSSGMIAGFLGHLLYDQLCVVRLEFLLHQNFPELICQLREAEEYMDEQQLTNLNYTGPIRGNPEWVEYLKSFWGDIGQRK